MKDVDIIKTEICHVDDIITIEKLSFEIPWTKKAFIREINNNKLAIYLSAKIKDVVVGYVGMWKIIDEGHITNIAIHPEFRRVGIGSMLLEELINISKEKGIEKLTLEVRRDNKGAQTLYKKFGFKEAGVRKKYYGYDNEDAIIMWRE